MASTFQTRHSLLQRATDLKDEGAWEEIVQQYRHFILCVLNQLGVSRDNLEDLSQQILIALTQSLPRYDRNRAKFRVWLSTIVRNKAYSYFRKQYSTQRSLNRMSNESQVHGEITAPEIEVIIDREWAAYIASQAMQRVRENFQGQAVEVFEMGLDGHSAAHIAEKTKLTVATVYTLKKRVKKRLYLEIRQLSSELER
ncbi:sigma-70 family RNA polymerase sigma factor [Akkermansiaceae bacterium]|nr:sigma-70 family RNA polymerase sigma factor [Akkermansiaceae bacterium]